MLLLSLAESQSEEESYRFLSGFHVFLLSLVESQSDEESYCFFNLFSCVVIVSGRESI